MSVTSYLENISKRYALGNATEHTFRGDLQRLIEELVPDVAATNEPKRIECGAPDYVITRKDIPVGYIEAKDVGVDLDGKNLRGQFDRYRDALDNLVFTDYLDFHFYVNGGKTASIRIAELRNGKVTPIPANFDQFTSLLKEFCSRTPVTIRSAKKLAEMMAEKAKILAYIIKNALDEDLASGAVTDLTNQMKAFKDILIHDIDAKSFADIYAQTIAYGMFAARLHDDTLDTFSRKEAAEKIPKTNPFLRKLFQFIAAFDLDTRIDWIVDALADLFRATDIKSILKNFGRSTQTHDPIMHFYETFLAEYDPKLRKSRGVFYTPEPVVDFIVRAVDDILKSEFGLADGLADTSKTTITLKSTVKDDRTRSGYREDKKEVHKVQILDPATGTGTFLATVIRHIYKRFENQQGVWSQYVDEHLIPRLNGFELLMASYAMAHLKLDLLMSETGYKAAVGASPRRFQVYLTNALEEYHPDTGTLFAQWLSTEANEANHIKRDTPVMVVIGNPPYSGESANKGKWIMSLMEDYKKEPGGVQKLKERNPKWINDDYVKFLRYGQHFIEKNGEGILAFINNHGFLDNPTFRGMRWNLLKSYDKIFVLDLHGNAKKKETAPNGSPDKNVFDIQQGVSINILVKTGKKKKTDLADIYHYDVFGTREAKYQFLEDGSLESIDFSEIAPVSPNFFMVPKNFGNKNEYESGFGIAEMFPINNVGVVTGKDKILIGETRREVTDKVAQHFARNADPEFVQEIQYRPFDNRFIYYDPLLVERAREKLVWHFLQADNIGLTLCKQFKTGDQYVHAFIANHFIESCYVSNRTSEITSVFPLYEYLGEGDGQQCLQDEISWTANLDEDIVNEIGSRTGARYVLEGAGKSSTFSPLDILDYIYAVLYSPIYRERYKEFLKIDFPRIPYPKDADTFWQLVKLGGELRRTHLLESPTVSKFITRFPVSGDNVVGKPSFKNSVAAAPGLDHGSTGDVYFNDTQYFAGVPEIAWNFYIGGYQPARKWLKDRKGRKLSYDDIQHYQKIIVALTETDRLMKEIDAVSMESPGAS